MIFKILILTCFLCYTSATSTSEAETKSATVPVAAEAPQERSSLESLASKAKPLESKPAAPESLTLYRHDQSAGVYRTESGDLVRMYRVELASGPPTAARRGGPGRRASPITKQRSGVPDPSERERMFGDWFNNYYNPYGGLGTYSYNYNYGSYPYNYNSYYYPYSSYVGGYYPWSGINGLYGMGY